MEAFFYGVCVGAIVWFLAAWNFMWADKVQRRK